MRNLNFEKFHQGTLYRVGDRYFLTKNDEELLLKADKLEKVNKY